MIKKNSLKFKIWIYLGLFSVLILLFLWLFQVIFINRYYEFIKTKDIMKVATKLAENYKKNDFNTIFDNIAYDENICIEIINDDNTIWYTSGTISRNCLPTNDIEINQYKYQQMLAGKSKINFTVINPKYNNKTLVYGLKLDDDYYAFINTSLVPIDSTITILKDQLLIVSVVVLVLSIIIAYYISKKISSPIIQINKDASSLAKGEYNIKFKSKADIKEINELVDTLNYTKNELAKTEELRRELLANISHDLKTPLTMIKAYSEMVRDLTYNNQEKRENNCNVIIEECERLNILVNDILDLSKIQSNLISLNYEEFDLTELIKTIINRYEIFSLTEKYKFILNTNQAIIINADKKKIEQVIYNLISNAINYTGNNKEIYINIIVNINFVRVEIKDTGKGIAKEDLNKIWDKYYTTNKKYQRNTIGTGLGLSIVKNILKFHNFNYGVTSVKDKGSCFFFDVPISKKEDILDNKEKKSKNKKKVM